jgi:hypothetical protein
VLLTFFVIQDGRQKEDISGPAIRRVIETHDPPRLPITMSAADQQNNAE